MSKFEDKRLGYGAENPLIKKGAKGYFSDSLKDLKLTVNKGYGMEWGTHYSELKNDPEITLQRAYVNSEGWYWQFFYVVEEAPEPKYRPYTNHELLDMIGFQVRDKESMRLWKIQAFTRASMEEAVVSLVSCEKSFSSAADGVYRRDVTARKLLAEFTHTNGVALGKYIGD